MIFFFTIVIYTSDVTKTDADLSRGLAQYLCFLTDVGRYAVPDVLFFLNHGSSVDVALDVAMGVHKEIHRLNADVAL